ncbi:MAG: hypothetical protein ACRC2H_03690 [Silanimonas sp.]
MTPVLTAEGEAVLRERRADVAVQARFLLSLVNGARDMATLRLVSNLLAESDEVVLALEDAGLLALDSPVSDGVVSAEPAAEAASDSAIDDVEPGDEAPQPAAPASSRAPPAAAWLPADLPAPARPQPVERPASSASSAPPPRAAIGEFLRQRLGDIGPEVVDGLRERSDADYRRAVLRLADMIEEQISVVDADDLRALLSETKGG